MQLMLEQNGAFDWKCPSDSASVPSPSSNSSSSTVASTSSSPSDPSSSSNTTCPDQTAALLNVNLIASTTQIASPLLGHFLDQRGPRAGAGLLTIALWLGLILLTVASTRNTTNSTASSLALDRLLYVGFALLALVTWTGGLMTVQVGLYFNDHTRSRVIFILNALFDAGSVVYLLLWMLVRSTSQSVSLTAWMGMFLGLGVIVMVGSLYFWTVTQKAPTVDKDGEEENSDSFSPVGNGGEEESKDSVTVLNDGEDTSKTSSSGHPSLLGNKSSHESTFETAKEESGQPRMESVGSMEDAAASAAAIAMDGDSEIVAVKGAAQDSLRTDYCLVKERTHKQQLVSRPFLLLCAYFSIHCVATQ